jgi:flagellar biosynthesis protein FlhG
MRDIEGTICAVGGGKGGVGKSLVAVNAACALALDGYEVILVDADLAGANVHTLFGIKQPPVTLNEFVRRTIGRIDDLLVPTALKKLRLICGATDFIDLANPVHARKQRIIRAIGNMAADFILVDIGAGATFNNLDFFNAADMGIIVMTPEPTAILSGYEFLKMAVHRKILAGFSGYSSLKEPLAAMLGGDGEGKVRKIGEVIGSMREIDPDAAQRISSLVGGMNPRLIVNCMIGSEGEKVHRVLSRTSLQNLQVAVPFLGGIYRSVEIERSVRSMTPVMMSGPSAAADCFREIARRIASNSATTEIASPEADLLPSPGEASRKEPGKTKRTEQVAPFPMGLNETVIREGRILYVQTEDLGPGKSRIVTLIYLGGEIVFSKENGYADLGVEGMPDAVVRDKVRWQHRGIVSDVQAGKIDHKIAGIQSSKRAGRVG